METSTHCTGIANCTDPETSRSLFHYTDSQSGQYSNVCTDNDSRDTCDSDPPVAVSQSTDTASAAAATAESATTPDRPRPVSTDRPIRLRHRPARFLETVQAHRLIQRNYAARACYRLASSDAIVANCDQLESRVIGARATNCCSVGCSDILLSKTLQSCADMPRSRIFRPMLRSNRPAQTVLMPNRRLL